MHVTVVGLLLLAFWLYCILDVAMADAGLVRNLPKLVWLVLVVVVPTVGGVAWLLAGRPARARFRPGSTERRPGRPRADHPSISPDLRPKGSRRPPPRGPDDDPEFLRRLDEQLRRGEDGS